MERYLTKNRDHDKWRWKRTKGVREYQDLINSFLILDRMRGMSYDKLAKIYKLDKNNIRARILNGTSAK